MFLWLSCFRVPTPQSSFGMLSQPSLCPLSQECSGGCTGSSWKSDQRLWSLHFHLLLGAPSKQIRSLWGFFPFRQPFWYSIWARIKAKVLFLRGPAFAPNRQWSKLRGRLFSLFQWAFPEFRGPFRRECVWALSCTQIIRCRQTDRGRWLLIHRS